MGKIIQNYSMLEQLGEGVYGKVYKAVHMKTKQQVAIKVIHAQKFKQIPKLQECTVNQINILSSIQDCPYIVKYIDMLKTVNNFYFVYEYCNGGTLDRLMQKEGPFPQKRAIIYFRQMIQAFKVLSKNNIMHRDLKPDNILMNNGMIKLGDFGFCKPLQSAKEMANTMLGSPIYMAPEVLKGQTYNMKADIWSLGVVLFQMVFGKCPFQSKSIAKLIKLLDEEDLVVPENPKISQILKDLIKRMLVKDHNVRIDWPQIFEYVFTETGDIIPPKSKTPLNQFQLRGSLRAPGSFGMNLSGSTNFSTSPVGSLNNLSMSQSTNSQSTQPTVLQKSHKPYDYDQSTKNLMMKKRSPMKSQTDISIGSNNNNQSFGFKNDMMFAKNGERPGRIQMLIKNHGKIVFVNQIAMDCVRNQKEKNGSLAVSYILFKSMQKELTIISQGLRKQVLDTRAQQFRLSLDNQLKQIKQLLLFYKQCISQQTLLPLLGSLQQPNKMRVMKHYYQTNTTRLQNQMEQLILAAQVIDYLDEGMLVRREAYERIGREALGKQVRGKWAKYV